MARDKFDLLEKHVDETEARLKEIEAAAAREKIEKGIRDGVNKWIRTVCITATGSVLSFFAWLGNYVYNHSHAFYEAAKAFIIAIGQGK